MTILCFGAYFGAFFHFGLLYREKSGNPGDHPMYTPAGLDLTTHNFVIA
jgi:hypothetical protein